MIRAALAMVAVAAIAGPSDPQRELDAALSGRVPGKPETCLSSNRASGGPQIVGDRILLYRDGSRIWRNDLPDACPGLTRDPLIVSEVYGGQICRNDGFYTVERSGLGIPSARCRLGSFVPWDRVKPPAR